MITYLVWRAHFRCVKKKLIISAKKDNFMMLYHNHYCNKILYLFGNIRRYFTLYKERYYVTGYRYKGQMVNLCTKGCSKIYISYVKRNDYHVERLKQKHHLYKVQQLSVYWIELLNIFIITNITLRYRPKKCTCMSYILQ